MRGRKLKLSDEYIESLCEWMVEWGKEEHALTVPQFLRHKGLGYPFLKHLVETNNMVANAFEIMKYHLHSRWLERGMSSAKMPDHQVKIMMKYISVYDSHAHDMATQARREAAEAKGHGEAKAFLQERYGDAELSEPYKTIYDKNDSKRRKEDK